MTSGSERTKRKSPEPAKLRVPFYEPTRMHGNNYYITVSTTLVLIVTPPEFASTVIAYVPAGVPVEGLTATGGAPTKLLQATRLIAMASKNTVSRMGAASRILAANVQPANQMMPIANAIPARTGRRGHRSVKRFAVDPDERAVVITDNMTFALDLPAATLGGLKETLDMGGSLEAVKVTECPKVPFSAASSRL